MLNSETRVPQNLPGRDNVTTFPLVGFLILIVGVSLYSIFRLFRVATESPIDVKKAAPLNAREQLEEKLHELQDLNTRALETIQSLKVQLRDIELQKTALTDSAANDLSKKLEGRLQDLFSEVEQIYRENRHLDEFQRLAPKLAAILEDLQQAETPKKTRSPRAVKK